MTHSADDAPQGAELRKRSLFQAALAIGAGAAMLEATVQPARAQLLDTGIDPKSVLAKVRKGGTLQVGYAQTPVWFYKDAKSGELRGVYKDLVDLLAQDLEMKVEWQEVTFSNATIGLRKGDFDLFGSSAVYTVPRGLAADFVGPLWSKGSLAIIRTEDQAKYKTIADLNSPDVTFSVNTGASEEQRVPVLFPKAKMIAVAGQQAMAAEPVRTGRATVYITGDSDAIVLAKRNASWAHVIDQANPFDKRPNTWLVRHGDPAWKNFLDMWCTYATVNGRVQRLYDQYMHDLT
jgi:polar amino acid transport system substrate-binding protein